MQILVARAAAEIEFAYTKLATVREIGCDTETSGLSARHKRLLSVQFSDGDFNVLVPVSEGTALGKLSLILENSNQIKIFHNAKFDLEFLRENGYQTNNVFDTMIAEKILTHGAHQSVSLAETLYRYFAVNLDKSQRAAFTSRSWNGVWTPELIEYALSDVIYLPELKRQQEVWMDKLGIRNKFVQQLEKLN